MFPAAAKKLDERAWNAFPYCKTQLSVRAIIMVMARPKVIRFLE